MVNCAKIKGNTNSDNAGLVIYGDNIKANYEPFVKDGGLYISVDTISKTIDKTAETIQKVKEAKMVR